MNILDDPPKAFASDLAADRLRVNLKTLAAMHRERAKERRCQVSLRGDPRDIAMVEAHEAAAALIEAGS